MDNENTGKKLKGLVIDRRYVLIEQIDFGGFGEVYLAHNKRDPNDKVAVKLEPVGNKTMLLQHEESIYKTLKGLSVIPNVRRCNQEHGFNILIMDYLGPSLQKLFVKNGRRFSEKTVLLLAVQLIETMEIIHAKGIVHGDVKPGNFVIGRGDGQAKNQIFLIDFGLATPYRDPSSGNHILQSKRTDGSINGTLKYCSVNVHFGIQQTRRDDLESLAYIFISFLKGSLPWSNLNQGGSLKCRSDHIRELKTRRPIVDNCPSEFIVYLEYCQQLDFDQTPDYEYLKNLFKNRYKKRNYGNRVFDWNLSVPIVDVVKDGDIVKRKRM